MFFNNRKTAGSGAGEHINIGHFNPFEPNPFKEPSPGPRVIDLRGKPGTLSDKLNDLTVTRAQDHAKVYRRPPMKEKK